MLWLALHLPLLSLEAFCATLPAGSDERPVALIHEHHVAAANVAALSRGIRPGCTRATALALAADLVLGQADPQRDARAQLDVAQAALACTPSVTVEGTGLVLLEVQASLRYFGGHAALLARLRALLAPLGHRVQIASAPTALGAAVLARWRDDLAEGPHSRDRRMLQALLDTAPVWMLGPAREHWEALQGMGLRQLEDLRRLPRSGLARRFGETLLDDLDRARGERPDPRRWLALPPHFESHLELYTRADTSAQLIHAAAHLMARLVAWAGAQQARVQAWTLVMKHEARHRGEAPETSTLRIELATPSADAAHLLGLLHERLARCELAAPTLEIAMRCHGHELHRGAPASGELFPTRQSESEGFGRLVERLRARLGDEQVLALQPVADHRPERGTRAVPVQQGGRGAAPRLTASRPLWLVPEPQPLPARDDGPLLDGRPLQLLVGPERIESGWWDGALATRDYYVAQQPDGALVWVFRDRLPAAGSHPGGWFLHGRYG
ncbi:MAG: DNA polymerase Y family protein [Rubrivivax sp.]|nr:DNA polymerase Y family protein [Rubrivivax sp.]